MFTKSMALLAVSALVLSAQAVPQPTGTPTPTEVDITVPFDLSLGQLSTGLPLMSVLVSAALSDVNAHSSQYISYFGTSTFLSVQADLDLLSASGAIGTATQLTAYVTEINATPIAIVSSKGGQALTLATGTSGSTTVFAGATFAVVPNSSAVGAIVPRSLLVGVATVLGCMAAGAVAVL